jgi:hypothetical protein
MILATEFIWAKRLVLRMRRQAEAMAATTEDLARRSNPWAIPPVLLIHAAAFLALYEWVDVIPDLFIISTYSGTLLVVGFWAWRVVARYRRCD